MLGSDGPISTTAVFDTGAECNVVSRRQALEWNLLPSPGLDLSLGAVGKGTEYVYGAYSLRFEATDQNGITKSFQERFYAIDRGAKPPLLAMPAMRRMDVLLHPRTESWKYNSETPLISLVEATEALSLLEQGETAYWLQPSDFTSILQTTPQAAETMAESTHLAIALLRQDFADVFWQDDYDPPPCEGVEHAIETTGDPPFGPIYILSATELAELRRYLSEALAKGWIQESTSPAGSPILFVPKKDGALRLCVDYRGLNKVTIKNRYPLPLISEILDRVAGAKYFSKIDLKDAYHRIRIKPSDRWKTAFRTRYGHYEYVVMPFGLTNAPATFQAYINRALAGLVDIICIVYLDDILIFSKTEEEHEQAVRQVLERLRNHRLYANPRKCQFYVKEIEFLGFILSPAGVKMDPSRVSAIADWPTPTNHHEVQVFIGFTNFYRRFIESYSRTVTPLTRLLRGGKQGKHFGEFKWDASAEQAFTTLRSAFTQAPLLQHYDPSLPIRVETDASGFALAAILSQQDSRGHWHPVAFWSRQMSDAETRYQTHDQELLAIVEALRHWRHYLEGVPDAFEVLTDHNNLAGFLGVQRLNGRQARWAMSLAAYDFNIKHRPGKLNPADAPSRRPDYSGVQQVVDTFLPTLSRKLALESLSDVDGSKLVDAIRHDTTQRVDKESPEVDRIRADEVNAITSAASQWLPRSAARAWIAELVVPGVEPLEPLLEQLQRCQAKDMLVAKPKLDSPVNLPKRWSVDNGLLRYRGKVYVPDQQALRLEIIRASHDDPLAGHFGRDKTIDLVRRHFHWGSLNADVEEYVRTCEVCQKTKARRHRPYGELNPLPTPTRPFEEITMDFITGLPPSKRGASVYDAILVIVDRLTKLAIYVPTNVDIEARGLSTIFFDEVIRHYGMPVGIVSDRGSVFTSEFWRLVCSAIGAKRKLSTAFHPQTDGQTERQNQTLKHYLQAYVDQEQSNWATMLHTAEFAYNRSKLQSIGSSPFELLMGYDPQLLYHRGPDPNEEASTPKQRMLRIVEARAKLEKMLTNSRKRMATYYNPRHQPIRFVKNDLVLLSTKNIRLKAPSKKLAARFIGPFRIAEVVGPQSYRLHLPASYKMHNVFNVEYLERYYPRKGEEPPILPDSIIVEGQEEWELDKILARRLRKGRVQYRVRWLGMGPDYDEWVDRDNVHADDLIREFEHAAKRAPPSNAKAKRLNTTQLASDDPSRSSTPDKQTPLLSEQESKVFKL